MSEVHLCLLYVWRIRKARGEFPPISVRKGFARAVVIGVVASSPRNPYGGLDPRVHRLAIA